LEGGVALPADGPNWQVMRPSRNRAWGHPFLIALLERLAQKLPAEAGWPGLLVGDIAQPRGGPMVTGHGSHQIGLDADIWLTPMPSRRLSPAERDEMPATDVVAADGSDVDEAAWTPQHRRLLEAVAREPGVERLFVNPAIKRALCREAGPDRAWLAKIRPWWGHNYHFHMRLFCPSGQTECRPRRATAAARSSIGGLLRRHATRRRGRLSRRCWSGTSRAPAASWSPRRSSPAPTRRTLRPL
jgi:penicillin-insensitive murein endopeptidase